MPRLSHSSTPRYRRHRASGQAVVTLSGIDHYLGPHGSKFRRLPNSYRGSEDRSLEDRIGREMAGILNWTIRGLEMLEEAGDIRQPSSGAHLAREMVSITSPVSVFIEECCQLGSDAEIDTKELFAAWEAHCRENDIDHPGTVQNFSRKLKAVIPQIDTRQARSFGQTANRSRFFIGIKLKPEDPADSF